MDGEIHDYFLDEAAWSTVKLLSNREPSMKSENQSLKVDKANDDKEFTPTVHHRFKKRIKEWLIR